VLLKGGHLGGDCSPDVVWDQGVIEWLEGPRLASRNTHGTGCALSAAICAQLAAGEAILPACRRAKEFVAGAIAAGPDVGRGVGPVNPGWCRPASGPRAEGHLKFG
jgi:hydroxymethylpyrimidine/phosphomethylpyrimidine kinase